MVKRKNSVSKFKLLGIPALIIADVLLIIGLIIPSNTTILIGAIMFFLVSIAFICLFIRFYKFYNKNYKNKLILELIYCIILAVLSIVAIIYALI